MAPHARERGSTLIISLVFLLVFLVMALSIFRGALTSSQAIGNMQWRNEAIAAANETIDRLLSNANVATQSATVVQSVNGVLGNSGIPYDTDGDGNNEILVRFPTINGVTGPQCLLVRPVPATALSPTREADAGCFGSSSASGTAVSEAAGGATPTTATSLCSDSEWSMAVQAVEPRTATSVVVVQGFAVRIPTVSVPADCE